MDLNKLAAKLYTHMHPGANFYKLSYENQQKYVKGVKGLIGDIKNG